MCTSRSTMPSAASFGRSSALDRLLDLGALGREDLAHRVAREHAVDHAVHGRLDELRRRRRRGRSRAIADDARRIERVAHRHVDAERQALDRLERRAAVRRRAVGRMEDLVAQRRSGAARAGRGRRAPCRRARRSTPPVTRLMRTPTSPRGTLRSGGCVHRPQAAATPAATSVSGSSAHARQARRLTRCQRRAARAPGRAPATAWSRVVVSLCRSSVVLLGVWAEFFRRAARSDSTTRRGRLRSAARRKHSRRARGGRRIIEPGCRHRHPSIERPAPCRAPPPASRSSKTTCRRATSSRAGSMSARPGLQVDQWFTRDDAEAAIARERYDLVVLDIELGRERHAGVALINAINKQHGTPVLVVSAMPADHLPQHHEGARRLGLPAEDHLRGGRLHRHLPGDAARRQGQARREAGAAPAGRPRS